MKSNPSPTRRTQLDALRAKRRRDRHNPQPEQVAILTYAQFVQEVGRQAMGKVARTEAQFNFSKPANWPSAAELCDRFATTFAEVCDEAGLRGRGSANGD